MPTAAQYLRQWMISRGTVIAQNGSVTNWQCTVGFMPDASTNPNNFVAVYDSGDDIRPRDMPGNNPLRYNCQVKVRGDTYPLAEAKARQVLADMQALADDSYETVVVSGTPAEIQKCVLTVGVTYMGQDKDQENLHFFSVNCRLTLGTP